MYQLAEVLGQPLSTIMNMTPSEYNGWFEYFRLKNEASSPTRS
jgi:hypothetical protein